MSTANQLVCDAPWCHNPTRRPQRKIGATSLCTRCYQHLWSQSRKLGKAIAEMEDLLKNGLIEAPMFFPQLDKVILCPRRGCVRQLHPGDPTDVMRRIGTIFICKTCYQSAWKLNQETGIPMHVAWKLLNVPTVNAPAHKLVECCLTWCDRQFRLTEMELTDHGHVCKPCQAYLASLASRPSYGGLTWSELVGEIFSGSRLFVPAPGEDEFCSAAWCNRLVIRGQECHRGPKGEPICNADGMYFNNYSLRNGISFDEAFLKAPPPKRHGLVRK